MLRTVLAALALRPGQVVAAAALADGVWPGVDDRVSQRRLRTAVWALRRALAPVREEGRRLIRWSPPGYVLEVDEARLDWRRFRRLRAAGEAALRRGAPGLAEAYLSAALELWRGEEALAGIEVSPDDLAFVADLGVAREQARRALVTARFQLGRYREVLPDLEAWAARDPLDDQAVWHLALAQVRLGNPGAALALCQRYARMVEEEGVTPSPRIAQLETAVLQREPWIDGWPAEAGAGRPAAGHHAFLACVWDRIAPSPLGPVPAELHLLVEDRGGEIHGATPTSVEASFREAGPALDAAVSVVAALGRPASGRAGVDVGSGEGVGEVFEGPPRARARLLVSAAAPGQVLVSGAGPRLLEPSVPRGGRLRALGRHRLNVLSPAAPIYRLHSPELPPAAGAPRWFDRGGVRNLAEEPYRFVGREREVAEVTARLAEGRLVTITGAPGSGKTRLAAHVAAGLSTQYQSGGWFVDLRPLSQPGLVAATVADSLQLPRGAPVPPVEALAQYLAKRHALVVLDNCEHVLEECRELVDRLLAACPRLAVLATSREALHSRLERPVAIAPLKPPPLGPSGAIAANAAVQLFTDRLGSALEGPRELRTVARICRAVEAIPLALVLAAARARELGLETLARILEPTLGEGRGLRILSGRAGERAAGRETLDGTMGWSYRLLPEPERRLFESLAVFRAGFTPEAAAAVCSDGEALRPDDVLVGLEHLAQASLVTVERGRGGSSVFRLLQPVRDYASSKLAARRRAAAALRRRHAEHFLIVA
ncbi:MAG TPA: BTAD domain-containing putative transcriptional regulator, partial [Actinomycetota bacterium]|nr:BTAD domain-containing putative transcriptional regulator [Actinomycetota bacterium]